MNQRWLGALCTTVLLACSGELRFDEPDAANGVVDATVEPDASVAPDSGTQDAALPTTCSGDQSCGLPTLHCDLGSGSCVECLNNGHCTTAGRTICNLTEHRCVECNTSSECAGLAVCERKSHVCIPTCFDGDDCSLDYLGCDISRGLCVVCGDDTNCVGSPNGPLCELANGHCVQCRDDLSCTPARPYCDTITGRCVACFSSDDCPEPQVCDPLALSCVPRTQ